MTLIALPRINHSVVTIFFCSAATSFKVSSVDDMCATLQPNALTHASHIRLSSASSSAMRTATKSMYFERAATASLSAGGDGDSAVAMHRGGDERANHVAKV
jgi:hypothetical protein